MSQDLKIYHLYHSGIAIEVNQNLLIFDYYNDKPNTNTNNRFFSSGVIDSKILTNYQQVVVFVTHSHSDHFNPVIFDWQEETNNIQYILSDDINEGEADNYHYLAEHQSLKLNGLNIESYGTTDCGVSFYVELDGINIFHSGDLNWWHWKKFSPEQRRVEERDYKEEVHHLIGKKIDIAFVPVDPRLEEYYYLAGEYFAKEIKPELLVPIHFADKYYITKDFFDRSKNLDTKVAVIEERGSSINFSKK